MTGIIERIQSAIGSDAAKIGDYIHNTFRGRLSDHGHFGRAFIETIVETAREHPAAVGLGVGVLVDRLLTEEKKRHEAHVAEAAAEPGVADEPTQKGKKPKKAKVHPAKLRIHELKPGRIAFEVFGGILLLKLAASGAHIFRHKHHSEVWFAPAAKIHLFSATLCAYNLSKALKSKNVSAWRNGAILFFGTDAIKPVIKWYRTHPIEAKPAAVASAPVQAAQPVAAQPAAAQPAYQPMPPPFTHQAPQQNDAAAQASPEAAPPPWGFTDPASKPNPGGLQIVQS